MWWRVMERKKIVKNERVCRKGGQSDKISIRSDLKEEKKKQRNVWNEELKTMNANYVVYKKIVKQKLKHVVQ
jgi:hypothetical protein